MYQSKEEAVEALTDVKAEIETILDEGVWVDEQDEEFLEDIEAVAEEMEQVLSELCGAMIQLATSPNQYLDQHHRNYVALTVIEAKELISKFNILQNEIA